MEENEQSMPSSPRKDLISSHTDSEDGWSDGDTRGVRPLPGMLFPVIQKILSNTSRHTQYCLGAKKHF